MLPTLYYPELSDCRRLFLRNYEVQINIGVHEFEKKGEQRVLINVDLFIPLSMSTPQVSAPVVVNAAGAWGDEVAQGHIHLQETLCDDVARAMLAHPKVRAVRVSTEKPDVYPDCASVGVEVFQVKQA